MEESAPVVVVQGHTVWKSLLPTSRQGSAVCAPLDIDGVRISQGTSSCQSPGTIKGTKQRNVRKKKKLGSSLKVYTTVLFGTRTETRHRLDDTKSSRPLVYTHETHTSSSSPEGPSQKSRPEGSVYAFTSRTPWETKT